MEENEMRSFWAKEKLNASEVSSDTFREAIKTGVRNEIKKLASWFWTTYVYHFILYVAAVNVFVRCFGDRIAMSASALIILAFIPSTWVLTQRLTRALRNRNNFSLIENLHYRYAELESFFVFKKRYELILTPLSLIYFGVIFHILSGSNGSNWMTAGFVAFFGSATIIVIRKENRNNFKLPLERFADLARQIEQG